MRRMIIAAAAAFLALSGLAWADGPNSQWHVDKGPIVRWNAIVGTHGNDPGFSPELRVANIEPGSFWVWVESGTATLDLASGRVAIDMRYASIASSNANTPLGSRMGSFQQRAGIFVCDATATSGDVVLTEPLYLDDTASLHYRGSVVLPDSCRERPDQIVFLLGNIAGTRYFAFGAAQGLLNSGSH
jgi:hypothetical protein